MILSLFLQVKKQHPKIYISPLLLEQLQSQVSSKKSENSDDEESPTTVEHSNSLSKFCVEATRVFSEALIIKLDAKAVNNDIMVSFVTYQILQWPVL